MKNIIIAFFKVGGLTMIAGLSSFLLLLLLFKDVLGETFFLIFIVVFLGGLTVSLSFLLVYLPVYYLNKNLFEKESTKTLFEKFLPVAIAPITGIYLILITANPHDFFSADAMVVVLMGYILTYFSFYQFISILKD